MAVKVMAESLPLFAERGKLALAGESVGEHHDEMDGGRSGVAADVERGQKSGSTEKKGKLKVRGMRVAYME